MNFPEFSSLLINHTRHRHENFVVRDFLKFFSDRFGEKFHTESFGLYEFSEFVQTLGLSRPESATYLTSVIIRRYCRELESNGVKFKTSPINWKCPRKPDIHHFDPLSREEYRKLSSYLNQVIELIKTRLNLIEDAKNHQSIVETSGKTFSSGGKRFFAHQITLLDALSSLLKYFPDFPIEAEKEALLPGGRYFLNSRKVDYKNISNEVQVLRKRFSVQRITNVIPTLSDHPELGFQDCLDILIPNEEEAAAIRKAICLETGWSPDLVARINPQDFSFHVLDMDCDFVFLKTTKVKGTQRNNSYMEAKSMFAPSSKSNKDSAYNLIRLWLKRTESLRQTKAYSALVDQLGFEPFFVIGTHTIGIRRCGPLRVLHPEFLKGGKNKSTINSKYKRNLGFTFDERRLRPTFLYFRSKDQNIPFALLVALFGHSHSAITEEYYQNGSYFVQDRKDKLSRALTEIDRSISDGSFAGELIPLREHKTLKDKIYSVFSDHSNQNPLAICSDPLNPTWPGHKKRIRPGIACRAFNKCLLCSKSQVFSENLPFVVDRYLYLEKKKRSLREAQFSIHLDEYNAAKNIVDSWPYPDDVEDAKQRTFIEGHLMPPVIMGEEV